MTTPEFQVWDWPRLGGAVGLDVLPVSPIPELRQVAETYLGPVARRRSESAPDPGLAFARAWTDLEARLKCVKLGLAEWSEARQAQVACCETATRVRPGGTVVTVAVPAARATAHDASVEVQSMGRLAARLNYDAGRWPAR